MNPYCTLFKSQLNLQFQFYTGIYTVPLIQDSTLTLKELDQSDQYKLY